MPVAAPAYKPQTCFTLIFKMPPVLTVPSDAKSDAMTIQPYNLIPHSTASKNPAFGPQCWIIQLKSVQSGPGAVSNGARTGRGLVTTCVHLTKSLVDTSLCVRTGRSNWNVAHETRPSGMHRVAAAWSVNFLLLLFGMRTLLWEVAAGVLFSV